MHVIPGMQINLVQHHRTLSSLGSGFIIIHNASAQTGNFTLTTTTRAEGHGMLVHHETGHMSA